MHVHSQRRRGFLGYRQADIAHADDAQHLPARIGCHMANLLADIPSPLCARTMFGQGEVPIRVENQMQRRVGHRAGVGVWCIRVRDASRR